MGKQDSKKCLRRFKKIIKRYFSEFKFKHPGPNDFKRVAEKVSDLELEWYLNDWSLGIMPLLSILGAFVFGFVTFFFYGRKTNRKGVFSNYKVLSFLFRSGKEGAEEIKTDLNTNEEEVINTSAEIVVPLLGDETSPLCINNVSPLLFAQCSKRRVANVLHWG